jgi:hypothetical protein
MDDAGYASADRRSFHLPGCHKEPTMNSRSTLTASLVAAVALAAAGAAYADDPTLDDSATQSWSQTKSRAQVQAELVQARADGTIKVWSSSYNPLALAKSVTSRDAVRADAVNARSSGDVVAMLGEDSGSFRLAQTRPSRDASQLLAAGKTALTR